MIAWQGILIVQVVKKKTAGHFAIQRRIVQGCQEVVDHLLLHSQGGVVINTAFIERLNATFRQRLGVLVRRTRYLARKPETLHGSMFLLGCVYNFCTFHKSLRLPLYIGERGRKWVQRTPAIAVGWTDQRWSVMELFDFQGTACSLGSASPAEQAFEGHVTAYSTVVLVTTLLCSATHDQNGLVYQ